MEFNYKKALKRQKFTEADIDELREKIKNLTNVPKSVSSKKVQKNKFNLEFFDDESFLCVSSCVS